MYSTHTEMLHIHKLHSHPANVPLLFSFPKLYRNTKTSYSIAISHYPYFDNWGPGGGILGRIVFTLFSTFRKGAVLFGIQRPPY